MFQSITGLFKTKKQDSTEKKIHVPIKYLDNIIQTSDRRYKAYARVSPINAELLAEDDLESVYEAVQGALNSYDLGRAAIYIQSERVNIDKNLDNIEKRKLELSSELKINLLEAQKKHLGSMTEKSRNVLSFYIVIETTKAKFAIAEEVLKSGLQSIKNELDDEDMHVDILEKNDIARLLYERMNPESSYDEPYQEDWNVEDIFPQNIQHDKGAKVIENDGRFYRYFAITKYPKNVDQYRWLKKVFNINGDVNIAITLTPKNKAKINEELSNAARELAAKARDTSLPLHIRKRYEQEEESADALLDDLGNDSNNLYDVNVTIGVSGKTLDKLETMVTTLRSRISSSKCKSTELKSMGFDPFWISIPLLMENRITKHYVWNLTSADIASIIPFDSSELMEEDGIFQGENSTSNGLIIINPFNKRKYNNPHQFIIADSGSGKSFYISCDAIRHLPYRDYLIMFDVEGEFFFPWAKKIQFTPSSGIKTNVFHIRNSIIDTDGHDDGKNNVGDYLSIKIMDSIVFFKWIYPSMTPQEEALLEEDISAAYEKVGLTTSSIELPEEFPTLGTLDEVMQEHINDPKRPEEESALRKRMKASFRPYIKGSYASMFNGQTNWEFEQHTIFDISKVSDTVRKPLYEILLKDTWQFSKADRKMQKRIYIDEAHEFADPKRPQTLEFVSTLVKRGRKYGVSIVTATQNLPDFLSIPRYGQAIIDNSFFKIFFRLGETDLEPARRLYRFSDKEMKILRQRKSKQRGKGKGIFIAGSQRVEIQTIASKYELEIIDPDQYYEIYKVKSRYAINKTEEPDDEQNKVS